MEKKWTRATFKGKKYLSSYSTSIEDAIEALQEAAEAEKSGEWKELSLDVAHDYGDNYELVIRGKRLETDAECAKREKAANEQKAYRLKMYNDLKNEFGDK